jgi:hypothetical protein
MTFDKIKNNGAMYVNKFGLVFIPFTNADTISISYNIDSDARLEIIKPVGQLSALFKSPDRVDYIKLYHMLY